MDNTLGKTFSFVNLNHPDELKDGETQTRIRRLAMTEVGRARRKPKTKKARNEIILEFRELPHEQQLQRRPIPGYTDYFDRIRGGIVDPFASYPIELNDSLRELVLNVFRADSPSNKALRGCWFTVTLFDPAPFYGMLANSQMAIFLNVNLGHGRSVSKDNVNGLSLYTKAISLVNDRLQDPQAHTDGNLIGAVASFLCHDQYIESWDTWDKHRDAMVRMIDMRGGPDTLDQESLRITVSWCELGGSFAQDTPPKLPLPPKWAENATAPSRSPRPASTVSLLWKQNHPMRPNWISIFDDVTQQISLDRTLINEPFEAEKLTGSWLEPALVRLLWVRPMESDSSSEAVIEEVCRLGTLLFLSPIWRYLGCSPVLTGSFTQKLARLLSHYRVQWGELEPLLAWSVYCAAIETKVEEETAEFTFVLAMLMKEMQIREWDEFLWIAVKSVLWVDKVAATFAASNNLIRDEVLRLLSNNLVPEVADRIVEIRDD